LFMPRAYDRAITIFSPEGRLYQVEYALELVKRGAPIVGVSSPHGVALAANESPESVLEDVDYFRKIFQLDEHVCMAIAGLSSDARVLISQARVYSQSNRLLYDEPVDVEILARRMGDIAQMYTQHAGVRPFGVSTIIAGVDAEGSRVMTTDPSGSYRGYKATAVGRKSDEANKLLEDKYKDDITLDSAISLAIEAVKTASDAALQPENVKVAVVPVDTKVFRRLSDSEVQKHMR
jgi:proteasome alpha subunit